jgi:predicted 3-demethylubiquinone-9 3-methyltransferase (glyoxalase superfamily)
LTPTPRTVDAGDDHDLPEAHPMPTLTPCLFFDRRAVEAAEFYASLFPESRVSSVARTAVDTPFMKEGDVLSVSFTVLGHEFVAINGGAEFPFTEAVSFQVHCEDQAEVDHFWDALASGGGRPGRCGWLKDRFGLSWQGIPRQLTDYLEGPDPAGCARAMQAMLAMSKLDIAAIRRAYEVGDD